MNSKVMLVFIVVVVVMHGSCINVFSQNTNDSVTDNRKELSKLYIDRMDRSSYAGMSIYVSGEVMEPGNFRSRNTNKEAITLKDVIARAGGQTRLAHKFKIYIFRDGNKYLIDKSIGSLGDILLDGGDLVFLPPVAFPGR